MKDLLKQAVEACINEDMELARSLYAQYFTKKSKHLLAEASELVNGSCDSCGEEYSTSKKIVDSGKWACGKCGSTKFDVDSVSKPDDTDDE